MLNIFEEENNILDNYLTWCSLMLVIIFLILVGCWLAV